MPRSKPASPARVHLRRMYMDCRYGQLHLVTAFPSSGGFDEFTPVICVPGPDGDSADFTSLATELGHDRSIYAIDPPGHGNSDGPGGPSRVATLVAAMSDLLDQLRLRKVDIIAVSTAAQAAGELATQRGEVRRLVVLGAAGLGVRPDQPMLELTTTDGDLAAQVAAIREFLDPAA